jgi:hypothetical protein
LLYLIISHSYSHFSSVSPPLSVTIRLKIIILQVYQHSRTLTHKNHF